MAITPKTNMQLPKLQYISDGKTFDEQYDNILSALDAGIQWIQLRWKNADKGDIFYLAEKIKIKCKEYQCLFVINDYPDIAQQIDADGVHLGLEDMKISEARKILLSHQMIGGTANTLEHVLQRINEQVNYIGLGPLRYTSTKEKLSPVLGFDGYKSIIQALPKTTNTPIYAIGGITEKDVKPLLDTGVYGIAVSSIITYSNNKKHIVQQFNQLLYETT